MAAISEACTPLEGPSWVELLPYCALFEELSSSVNKEHIICETRGDLFVWDSEAQCLLTTNLKRLHAQRGESHVYQVIVINTCTYIVHVLCVYNIILYM